MGQNAPNGQNVTNRWEGHNPREGRVTCTGSGRIVACDPPFAEILGYGTPDEFQDATESLGDLFADRLPGTWEPLVTGSEGFAGELRCLRRDGTSIWVELHVEESAEVGEVHLRAKDVTSRDHLEGQLQQAQQLALTGRISAGMTQDINNLLAAILAQVELAKGSLEIRDIVGVDRDLEDLRLTAHRGAQMVRQMLSFNRGDALDLETVELPKILASASRLIRPLLPESVVFRVVDDGPVPVRADAAAVEQILIKLALYARDAMGDGGRLTIRTGSTTISREECRKRGWGIPGEYGLVSVSDTGIGLAQDTVEQLFEPFFAEGSDESRPPGMVVVYALMKQHRGFVEVRSRSGEGSHLATDTGTEVRLLFRPAASNSLPPTDPRADRRPTARSNGTNKTSRDLMAAPASSSLRLEIR